MIVQHPKEKQNVLEKCIKKGKEVFKAVVADCGSYFLLIHLGRFNIREGKNENALF